MEWLLETLGDGPVLTLSGALVGLIFGIAAQRSRFCLRASSVEVAERRLGPRLAVWFLAFFTALLATQTAVAMGWLALSDARQLTGVGSLSGAIIGGLCFGVGMILARGCASRLLVLSATGNLRALLTGLVLTLVAQASLTGILAPLRESLSGLWVVEGSARDAMSLLGLSRPVAMAAAGLAVLASIGLAISRGVTIVQGVGAAIVGLAVSLGWIATYQIAQMSFDVVPVSSITFTGPATDTLMAFVTERVLPMNFGLGLVPGVFIGSALSAVVAREWKIERFGPDSPMERYLVGAVLMGFGAMSAGGCAVGAAIAGGSALSLTALVAGVSIWVGGMAAHVILRGARPTDTALAA